MQGRLEEQEQAEAACTQPSGQSVPADKLRSKVHNGVPPCFACEVVCVDGIQQAWLERLNWWLGAMAGLPQA